MGFDVRIEADYGSEILTNYPYSGKAVFAFVMGLHGYSHFVSSGSGSESELDPINAWYRSVEQLTGIRFFPTCQALLDCDWGDGGDHYEYQEDEYDLFLRRSGLTLSEEQFRAMLIQSDRSWQPITQVIDGVRLLLQAFEQGNIPKLEGFYVPEDTIPDFAALLANLELLARRNAHVVRLNSY